jgi:hypothetical protein
MCAVQYARIRVYPAQFSNVNHNSVASKSHGGRGLQMRLGGVRLFLLVSQRPKSLAYKQYVREHRYLVELHQRDPKKFPMDLSARAVVAKFKSLNPSEIAALDKNAQPSSTNKKEQSARAEEFEGGKG